jgi:hypothetical protein
MKHYTRLNELETQVHRLRENFALFDSVMEAHMNEFEESQTPLGLSLWRINALMRENTEEIKEQFYDLFDAIREDSLNDNTPKNMDSQAPWNHIVNSIQKASETTPEMTQFYPGWTVKFADDEPNMSNFITIDPTGGDSVPVESMQLDLFDSQDYVIIK